ncbi:MAG TPA: hypothetical protein VII52_13025 [Gemmatimonadaceae bacterium]
MIGRAVVAGPCIFALCSASSFAQKPPAVRQIGPLERATTDSLASAATAVPMPDGRVFVNDIKGRRLLLLDSTLAHPIVVADTTGATGQAYGRQAGTLIRYRADTALFIDIASLSMLVIGPSGNIVRVLAIPRPDDAQHLIGSVFGLPGYDARGRLIYHAAAGMEGTFILCCVGTSRIGDGTERTRQVPKPDSAFLVAVDPATRAPDTVATIRIEYNKQHVNMDEQGYVQSIETDRVPMPIVDGWAVTPDGSLAVVRGRDYHVDWMDANGRWTSSPKMPFDWRRLDDAQKLAIIDSSAKAEQAAMERNAVTRAAQLAARSPAVGGGRGGGRGGGGGAGGPARAEIPLIAGRVDLSDIPDYAPPFAEGAVYAGTDDNLWILTTALVDGRPVYDVVNRRGELFDRVQLPPFRTIAGFGPGVIYMAVKDSTGAVHLERARAR